MRSGSVYGQDIGNYRQAFGNHKQTRGYTYNWSYHMCSAVRPSAH